MFKLTVFILLSTTTMIKASDEPHAYSLTREDCNARAAHVVRRLNAKLSKKHIFVIFTKHTCERTSQVR